jgi:hypothetical protein
VGNPYAPPPAGSRPPAKGAEEGSPRADPQGASGQPPKARRPEPRHPDTRTQRHLPPRRVPDRDGERGRDLERGTDDSGERRPAPSPEVVAAGRSVLAFGLLTIGVVLATGLPLPWQVLGMALCMVALVQGVRALRAVLRAGARRMLPAVTIGLAVCALFAVSSVSVLATWPVQVARQDCLERALTISARETCEAEYRQALEDLVSPPGG